MAMYIVFFKFYDLYHNLDTNLDNLGFSAPTEKWAVKWLLKSVLFTTLLCQFHRFHTQRIMESFLKFSTIGIALTAAWIPCFKAYPTLTVCLMCLEMFFISIGPLRSIPILIRNVFDTNQMAQSLERLFLDKVCLLIFAKEIYATIYFYPELGNILVTTIAVGLLFCMLMDDVMQDINQERQMREQRENDEEEELDDED
ncbi:unnamed protein product [Caenorhabditis brenneri]